MGKLGLVKRAEDTFDLIRTDGQSQGVLSYQTLAEVYATNNLPEKALETLDRMHKEGYKPNASFVPILLDAASNDLGLLQSAIKRLLDMRVKLEDTISVKIRELELKHGTVLLPEEKAKSK